MFRTDGDLSTAPNRSALRGTPDTYRRAARTFNPCPGQGLRIGASVAETADIRRAPEGSAVIIVQCETSPELEERRRVREELFDPATFEQLECVGVRRGWSCLDAGAGRGSVAQWLARRVGPEGRVLAVDVDLELLGSLEEPLFEARRHDLGSDGRVGEGFDLVHSRFVLEHITRRDAVLSELVDQLRPGGWLVVQDAEFSATALTDVAAYAEAMATFERAMAAQGTDYRWTRQLPSAMARLGMTDVEGAGYVSWFHGGSQLARFWASNLEVMCPSVLALGLTEAILEQALDALFDRERWLPSVMVVAAQGRRPTL